VTGWSTDETDTILVGDRRMRVNRRRRSGRRINPWAVVGVIVVLVAAGAGTLFYLNRPQGLDSVDGPAVVAPGGFQAKVGADNTITVALEIRNVTDTEVTVVRARIVPPAGLTQRALTVLQPGEQNQNLNLDGDLPPSSPVTLGTDGVQRNAIVAARFTVDCDALPATTAASGEQMYVTVRLGADQREESLTSPVVDGTPWLAATARSACLRPTETGAPPTPLPPLTPLPPVP
jgi:hypothetical protein